MNNKEFKTIKQQIFLLKSKGLTINKSKRLEFYLTNYNYQNFINGYNDPFIKNFQRKVDIYLDSASSDSIIDLFNFDRIISSPLLSRIQNIERKFSSAVVHIIAKKFNYLGDKCGLVLQANDKIFRQVFKCDKNDIYFLKQIMINFKDNQTDLCNKYKNIENLDWIKSVPIWSLSIYWSFGNIIKIFKFTNKNIQREIIAFMSNNIKWNTDEFLKVMLVLKDFRNRICHSNVLYNVEIKNNMDVLLNFINNNYKSKSNSIRLSEIIKIIDIILPSKEEQKMATLFKLNYINKIKNSENISQESKKFILKTMNF